VERHISFFERFARTQKKPTFTRPLRKAASRIRRAMIGRSTTQKAPLEAAVFPFTPPKSPLGKVGSRGIATATQLVSHPSQLAVEPVVEASTGAGPQTSGSGSAYSDQQTILTWGVNLRHTNIHTRLH
jgi:hypothetical protein